MRAIAGSYQFDFMTQWRSAVLVQFQNLRVFLRVALVIWVLLAVYATRQWPAVMIIGSAVGALVGGFVMIVMTTLGTGFAITVIDRMTNRVGGKHSFSIDQTGIRVTRDGFDAVIRWPALKTVTRSMGCLLLYSDRWVLIPGSAFQTDNEFREAFDLCHSLQGTSETWAAAPIVAAAAGGETNIYAAPREWAPAPGDTRLPPRSPTTVARAIIPAERLSWLGVVAKLARHRPQGVLVLVFAIFSSYLLFRTTVSLFIGFGSFAFAAFRQNGKMRAAHAGLPSVVDFSGEGLVEWMALRQVQFAWRDTGLVAEDSDGFLVSARGGEFLFVPRDCMPPEDVAELRLLLREMLGPKARIR